MTIQTTWPTDSIIQAESLSTPHRVSDRPDTRETLERHRRVWGKKPSLRRVYEGYFRDILARCGHQRPIVELGSGPGFFKAFCPDLIATDVESSPWIDRVVDGTRLPFGDGEIGNLVMIDVFHHLPQPRSFLDEAARVLRPEGRIVMLEPWTSALGYLFYRHIHHEGADRNVNAELPFTNGKTAFEGNAALPRMYFESPHNHPQRDRLPRTLHLLKVERRSALSWLFTGGFQRICLLPTPLVPVMRGVDFILKPLANWVALRALITLERQDARFSTDDIRVHAQPPKSRQSARDKIERKPDAR